MFVTVPWHMWSWTQDSIPTLWVNKQGLTITFFYIINPKTLSGCLSFHELREYHLKDLAFIQTIIKFHYLIKILLNDFLLLFYNLQAIKMFYCSTVLIEPNIFDISYCWLIKWLLMEICVIWRKMNLGKRKILFLD